MIVKQFELKKKISEDINFYLFYGANEGLIEQTINSLLKPNFSKNTYVYEENEVLNKVEEFKENILNKSLFENNKLIIINRASDKILALVEEIIEREISDIKIVIKARILEKKSKLRIFFEKNKKSIITAFFEDNHQSLLNLTRKFFERQEIKVSSQIINFVIDRSKNNRIVLENELKKIALFLKNKSTVNFDDILKLTNSFDNFNISELTDNCLAKNQKKTLNIMNENTLSSEEHIFILKSFLYKLKRLKKLKENLNKDNNIDSIITSYKPPIFWKDKDIIKQQLKHQTKESLENLIKEVNKIENLVKRNSQISNLIINNFILENIN
jgi:DNA polymerase-3 subunit delta|tara:strand:+ start:504 stop:1487 length:984 start_codon:yes stop_codon:yes gene_type:complete